jgi:hypothetical protein
MTFWGFVLEPPSGGGWEVDARDDQLTFYRRKTWRGLDVGSTRISITAHPATGPVARLLDEEWARKLLNEEEARLRGNELLGGQVRELYKGQSLHAGKALYWMTYRTLYRQPSDEASWADDLWDSEGAFYLWFPEGCRTSRYFTFRIQEVNKECSLGTSCRLERIDEVIRSFRREPAVPTGPAEPTPSVDLIPMARGPRTEPGAGAKIHGPARGPSPE